MRGVHTLATLSLAVLASSPAAAQELDRAAPLIEAPKEYSATPIRVGAAAMLLGVDLRGEYLDNIFALPEDRIGDFRLTAFPWTSLTLDKDRFRLAARAQAAVQRYAEHTNQNSVAGLLTTNGLWRLSEADTLSFNSAIARAVQVRGAPESQRNPALSPRKSNVLTGELGYRHVGGRIVLTTRAAAVHNNALGRIDRERDFTQWSLQARAGVRASGTYQFFGESFVTRRVFDVPTNLSGINRDSRTIAGRGGVEIDPGGLVRGEASIGLFRFNPDDSSLDSRIGVSASASLIYQPRERLAFTLDAFNGDVVTVLNGAQQRTDTRLRFGIQQEIFHNLRWQGGVAYLRTKYNGNPATERTFGGIAEVEYLVNRRVAVALQGRHANRNSTDPFDEYRANSIGLELRLQY